MKKLAKILLVVLVVAALAGTLAFAVSADGAGEAAATSTLWTPVNDDSTPDVDESTLTIGVWSSADKISSAPDVAYLYSATISQTDTQAWPDGAYVVLFSDVTYTTSGTQNMLGGAYKVTIDLNGKTLTSSQAIRSTYAAGSHLVITNGKFTSKGQIQSRAKCTLEFEGVTIRSENQIGYTSGGNYTFRNCTITSTYAYPFSLGSPEGSSKLQLINTTLYLGGKTQTDTGILSASVNATAGAVFHMADTSTNNNFNYEIFIDKDSKIRSTNSSNVALFSFKEDATVPTNFNFTVNIEAGALLRNISTRLDYCWFTATENKGWSKAAEGAPNIPINIVRKNSAGEYVAVENPEAITTYIVDTDSVSRDYVTFITNVPYEPQAGEYMGYWASEENYTKGYAPVGIYNSKDFDNTYIQSLPNNAYLVLFQDCNLTSTADLLKANCTLNINLNDKTLKTGNFRVGPNGNTTYLNIENGTFKPNQLKAGMRNNIYMYDVTFESGYLIYSSMASNATFEKCTITVTSTALVHLGATESYGKGSQVNFIDTDIYYKSNANRLPSTNADPVSGATYGAKAIVDVNLDNSGATRNCGFIVTFDKDSTISQISTSGKLLNSETPNWLAISNLYPTNVLSGDALPKVIIEEGFRVSASFMPDFTYLTGEKASDGKIYYTENARNDSVFTLVDSNGAAITDYHGVLDQATGLYKITKTESLPTIGNALQANLTLYTNFELNFFSSNSELVSGIYNNGLALTSEKVEEEDKYVIAVPVNKVADDVKLMIEVKVGEETHIYPKTYSVLTYAEQVIGGDYTDADKGIVSAAMEYAKAAYTLSGKDAFAFNGTSFTAADNTAEKITSINDAIAGVQLNLDSGFKLRFNLVEGYKDLENNLIINGTPYELAGTLEYVEVDLRAFELADAVEITYKGETVSYGIANYAKSDAVAADTNLEALVNALYTYCVNAKEYKAAKN